MAGKLMIGDVIPAVATQVGPVPVGGLSGLSGRLAQSPGGAAVTGRPASPDWVQAFRNELDANGLRVCDQADGAPYDFGAPGYPLSLWVRSNERTGGGGDHPDVVQTVYGRYAWSWSTYCIFPAPGKPRASGEGTFPINYVARYGRPGTVPPGSFGGDLGRAGSSWAANWDDSGVTVTAGVPPGPPQQQNPQAAAPWRWRLENGGPLNGYYTIGSLAVYFGNFAWSTDPFPDPVGLFCVETTTLSIRVPSFL